MTEVAMAMAALAKSPATSEVGLRGPDSDGEGGGARPIPKDEGSHQWHGGRWERVAGTAFRRTPPPPRPRRLHLRTVVPHHQQAYRVSPSPALWSPLEIQLSVDLV